MSFHISNLNSEKIKELNNYSLSEKESLIFFSNTELIKLKQLLNLIEIFSSENGNYIKINNNTLIDVKGSLVTKTDDFNILLSNKQIHFNPNLNFENLDDFKNLDDNIISGNKKALKNICNCKH